MNGRIHIIFNQNIKECFNVSFDNFSAFYGNSRSSFGIVIVPSRSIMTNKT